MPIRFIVQLVDMSRRYALAVVVVALVSSLALGWYVVGHIKINTNINQLLSADLIWRQREMAIEKAFPRRNDLLIVVIDGDTPDDAEDAAATLAGKLAAMPAQFHLVTRPDSIPFFEKNGLLYLSTDELTAVLNNIVQAQPLLGTLASDPSLRGLFSTLSLILQGVQQGQADYVTLDQPITKVADTIFSALAGKDKPLGWQSMMAGQTAPQGDLRKFIITQPVLNYTALEPGEDASKIIRDEAKNLNLTPEHGIRIRLTGSVALNDEEFGSVAQGTSQATILSIILVFVILFMALRSFRIIIPILLTLGAGLTITTAFALVTVGSLNLISVAFAVMFVGIAVDFGIQFGVRYRDQHHQEPDHDKAMVRTAEIIALPLLMAAASTSIGFLAFMPTDYRGVAELGLIAGAGMLIAFFLNITLLPALLSLARPPAEPDDIGFHWAAPIDRFLSKYRFKLLAIIAVATIGAVTVATQLRFDFDPLSLKDPHTESVSTLFDLMKDPNGSPYTIQILSSSLESAQQLADKIQELPEVDHTMTLNSFVPDQQEQKLGIINDANQLLGPTLSPPTTQAPPTMDENLDSLRNVAASLHQIGTQHPSAEMLAKALDQVVERKDPALLQHLQNDLISGMQTRLSALRQSLTAEPIKADTISEDLRGDWISPDGQALIEVYPKGNPRDHKTLVAFTDAVRKVAPDASGSPISIRESGKTITAAFIHAGIYALLAIALLALLILRRPREVILLIAPLILAGVLTLATIVVIGLSLNFANIIALPLLLSLGVSYAIYFISAWHAGMENLLQSSVARAVLFSAATALVAFGSLSLSSHLGMRSMGELLTISLVYSLICTFFVLPVLLGPPNTDKH